jgi:hypothetical protein
MFHTRVCKTSQARGLKFVFQGVHRQINLGLLKPWKPDEARISRWCLCSLVFNS